MAGATALKDAIVAQWEAFASGVRPSYGRHNKPYKKTRREPDVGASSHRNFWFLPPKGRQDQGIGASVLTFDGEFEIRLALNFAGLDLDERFEAVEAEAVFLMTRIKILAHPAGIRVHATTGWDWESEDTALDDVTLIFLVTYTAAEAVV